MKSMEGALALVVAGGSLITNPCSQASDNLRHAKHRDEC